MQMAAYLEVEISEKIGMTCHIIKFRETEASQR